MQAKKTEANKGLLNITAVELKIDPAAEWEQIFDEVWRINRDYFYDPGMHGADWPAMKEKYAPFINDVTCRDDLNRVIMWMCSEISVGHHQVTGGDPQLVKAIEIALDELERKPPPEYNRPPYPVRVRK
jgi:tricorn protease